MQNGWGGSKEGRRGAEECRRIRIVDDRLCFSFLSVEHHGVALGDRAGTWALELGGQSWFKSCV